MWLFVCLFADSTAVLITRVATSKGKIAFYSLRIVKCRYNSGLTISYLKKILKYSMCICYVQSVLLCEMVIELYFLQIVCWYICDLFHILLFFDTLMDPWNVCVCLCMYVCLYVCMYVCTRSVRKIPEYIA